MKQIINPWLFWLEVMLGPIMIAVLGLELVEALIHIAIVVLANILYVLVQIYDELYGFRKSSERTKEYTEDARRSLALIKQINTEHLRQAIKLNEEQIFLQSKIKNDLYDHVRKIPFEQTK